jgi:hypothetical protein
VVYHLLKYREAFNPESAAAYTRKRHEPEVKQLTRRAQELGYTLIPADASPPVSVLRGRVEMQHRRDTMIGLCFILNGKGFVLFGLTKEKAARLHRSSGFLPTHLARPAPGLLACI